MSASKDVTDTLLKDMPVDCVVNIVIQDNTQ